MLFLFGEKVSNCIIFHSDWEKAVPTSGHSFFFRLDKLEASVHLGYTSVAPTSIACAWNKVCTKKVEADMMKGIKFYTDKAKRKRGVGKKSGGKLRSQKNNVNNSSLKCCLPLENCPLVSALLRDTQTFSGQSHGLKICLGWQ